MVGSEIHRLRKSNSSGDVFSFPRASSVDRECDEFEFGCLTRPGSPRADPGKDSPADHLFFNGRLLPHAFPTQLSGRASSVSSRDSMTTSSRSNSANSRSSSSNSNSNSSSARTSSSDSSERRLWIAQSKQIVVPGGEAPPLSSDKKKKTSPPHGTTTNSKTGAVVAYGPSKKWQFIAAAPALKTAEGSRRKRGEVEKKQGVEKKANAEQGGGGIGRRVLRSFVAACRECHSMEPSTKKQLEDLHK